VGESTHDLIIPKFSTTTKLTKLVCEVLLLDTFSPYFAYTVYTMCGIPNVILLGTRDDWVLLREKVNNLSQFQFEWYVEAVLPILDQFIAAKDGNVDVEFWRSMYKYRGRHGSGGPSITGWVLKLFPYLLGYDKQLQRNNNLPKDISKLYSGPDAIPGSISKVDFVWEYLGASYNMFFLCWIYWICGKYK